MTDLDSIRTNAKKRGITRLCHFTPSRNLVHIASGRQGILASRHLSEDRAEIFNPTDIERWDGFPDHVCCSIQYPNAWYFSKARLNETLFRDWVVLLIDAKYLWRPGTKFSPINAASREASIAAGAEGFEALFEESVEGVRRFRRRPKHPAFLPTDQQAEVLVPDSISMQDISGVALVDAEQAAREVTRLTLLSLEIPRLLLAREFYNPQALSEMLIAGKIPAEIEYDPGGIRG